MQDMLGLLFEGSFCCGQNEAVTTETPQNFNILTLLRSLKAQLSIVPFISVETATKLLEVNAPSVDDFKRCTVHSLGLST